MFPPNAYIFVQDTSKWSDVKPIRVRDVPLITCPLLIRRNKTRDKCKGTEERDESWTCVLPLEKIHHNFRDAHPQRNDICDIGWFWFRQNPFSPVSWTLSCPPSPQDIYQNLLHLFLLLLLLLLEQAYRREFDPGGNNRRRDGGGKISTTHLARSAIWDLG